MPKQLLGKIAKLSQKTGETPIAIVQKSVALYERATDKTIQVAEDLSEEERSMLGSIMRKIAIRTASRMTSEERIERASNAAKARSKKLTEERRIAIATKAGRAGGRGKWKKKDESS